MRGTQSRLWMFVFFMLPLALMPLWRAQAQQDEAAQPEAGGQVEQATPAVPGGLAEEGAGMTLQDLLINGGWVMAVLAVLSVLALSLALYFAFALTQRRLIPKELATQVRHFLRDGRYEDIARLCRRHKGLFAKVVLAGIVRGTSDPNTVAATMETVGRRESENLMRQVRYLSDIATVAPMLGLLGTVLGMIRAFNFIAFDISAVKPVALASAVAQALVTTAAGLIVAIPCMGLFFYFRGKLQSIISEVEEFAVEITDSLTVENAVSSPQRKSQGQQRKSPRKSAPAQANP